MQRNTYSKYCEWNWFLFRGNYNTTHLKNINKKKKKKNLGPTIYKGTLCQALEYLPFRF